jgi:hypothetical protein
MIAGKSKDDEVEEDKTGLFPYSDKGVRRSWINETEAWDCGGGHLDEKGDWRRRKDKGGVGCGEREMKDGGVAADASPFAAPTLS